MKLSEKNAASGSESFSMSSRYFAPLRPGASAVDGCELLATAADGLLVGLAGARVDSVEVGLLPVARGGSVSRQPASWLLASSSAMAVKALRVVMWL